MASGEPDTQATGDGEASNQPAEALVIMPMPSLVSVLLAAYDEKGADLTEAEVLALRDNAESVAVPRDIVPDIVESRGYEDIDPENVWEEWQTALAEQLAYRAGLRDS